MGVKATLAAVSGALTLLVVTPLLGRGFVLSYDMVFAPRLWFGPDAFGAGSSLARSVPADAVIALITTVLPGDIVQKLVLALAIFFAAYGAGTLVPTERLGTRIVAATGYAWTAYFAERLFIGHWPLLLTYACLPWIVLAGHRLRDSEPKALAHLVLACAPAVLTPPGGILAALTAIVAGGRRRLVQTIGVSVVLNLPWLVPTLLHPGGSLSDPAGVEAFSARTESWGPAILSVLGLGGIWNGDVVPQSRSIPLTPIVTLLVIAVAIAGFRPLAAGWGVPRTRSLVALGVLGVLLASLATLPLGEPLLSWAMNHIPGAGLLRDAQKWVAWWALPVALGFALAIEAVAVRWRAIVVPAALLPLVLMPDLAWGGWGRLEPVQYPDDWAEVSTVLSGQPGDVLALPLSAFRKYAWNDYRTQLDPAPRFLPDTVLIDDTLRVGTQAIAGEDQRLQRVRASGDLAGEGIGWVLVEHGTPGTVDPRFLQGATEVWSGQWLTLYRAPGELRPVTVSWFPVMAANGVAVISIVTALLCCMLPMRRLIPGRTSLPQKE